MPHFNDFRINEELLGKVLVARKNIDLSATEEEQLEVRKFIKELEEEKRTNNRNIFVSVLEVITGKKYVQMKDPYGKKIIREYIPDNEIKPNLKLSITVERPLDFGDEVNEWRKYIHEENIRSEQNRIERGKQAKHRKKIVEAFSHSIQKTMMKLN